MHVVGLQTYYKLPYVDHRITNPEQRICEGELSYTHIHHSSSGLFRNATCFTTVQWVIVPPSASSARAIVLQMCADIPKLSGSLAELVREWVTCSIDAVFYAWQLRSYTKTDKYTAGIVAYVLGAGIATSVFAPSFGSLAKKEQELEGVPLSIRPQIQKYISCLRCCFLHVQVTACQSQALSDAAAL